MIRLYDFELSAECYRVRLMLSILGVRYEAVPVDVFPGREHESDWFTKLSPEGQLPVLDDGGVTIAGADPALLYLAGKFDPADRWLPLAAAGLDAGAREWLAMSGQLRDSAGNARLAVNFGYDHDLGALQREAHRLLRRIDEHLWFGEREGRAFLASKHPTIADIACFPDIVLCEEGGISRQDYPAVRRWLDRVKRIPGFTTMSGVFPTAPSL